MSYLILGSTSFAGSSLIDYLLSQGEQVIGVSRSEEPHPVMQAYFNNPNKSAFTFYQYDLNKHFDALVELIHKQKPSHIIDFAGQGMVAESWSDPTQWYMTNIIAKIKLHQILKDCDFLQRYVRVSTPEVYGNSPAAMKEDTLLNPSTPYAVSHAAIDMSLLAFHKQYEFPVILTRFANFYGPHQQLYRIVPRTIIYGMTGKKLPLHGGGISERMFIYAEDVASGIHKAIEKAKIGQIYHFTTHPLISIRTLVEKICGSMNVEINSFVEIAEERAGKDNKYDMDATKSMTELGWKPRYTLEQGLEKTVGWVRQHIDILQSLPLNYIHKP
ncbi:MAG: GDP-mannose 4,6-dehydratase [Gammaproteobacteria bacterium]|nr:GDP-mannose 4,6-dehydratase [Gammaproteobacteria bacterium]